MRLYRVFDNSTQVLTTVDELAALRLYRKIMTKRDPYNGWSWVDEDVV